MPENDELTLQERRIKETRKKIEEAEEKLLNNGALIQQMIKTKGWELLTEWKDGLVSGFLKKAMYEPDFEKREYALIHAKVLDMIWDKVEKLVEGLEIVEKRRKGKNEQR